MMYTFILHTDCAANIFSRTRRQHVDVHHTTCLRYITDAHKTELVVRAS